MQNIKVFAEYTIDFISLISSAVKISAMIKVYQNALLKDSQKYKSADMSVCI